MTMGNSVNGNEALKYYKQALSILEKSTPLDRQETGKSLKDMSRIYRDMNIREKGLQCACKTRDLDC
jgi:hypothetical protein